jgi:hypothetical protein
MPGTSDRIGHLGFTLSHDRIPVTSPVRGCVTTTMTTGPDGGAKAQTLSRSTAHLENLANILSCLQGGGTLLHELTQNANDAGESRVAFTATNDELTIRNDSTFSDCGAQYDSEVCASSSTLTTAMPPRFTEFRTQPARQRSLASTQAGRLFESRTLSVTTPASR